MQLSEIIEKDRKHYFNTFGDRIPIAFVSGDGCSLFDSQGTPYLDFFAGISVCNLGYNNPRFTKAVVTQVNALLHTSNVFYNEIQTQLAELLLSYSCHDRVFFTNSGAESNEGAIKLARKYFYEKGQQRYEVITALGSFHGRTLATLAATGQSKYHTPFEPMPASFVSVPYGDADAIESAINKTTCAVMLEPIQGEGGVYEGGEDYLRAVESICKKHGILLIFDEIQTGMGRTGKLFCYEHYGVEPDIMTLAKALGNGIPIGALLAKQEVAKAFMPGDHGSTFGGSHLACAAALAVVNELHFANLLRHTVEMGDYFKSLLQSLMKEFPDLVIDVRGRGLMLGMQIASGMPVRDIAVKALSKGFVIGTAGNNTLRFLPPLIIKRGHVDALAQCLNEILLQL